MRRSSSSRLAGLAALWVVVFAQACERSATEANVAMKSENPGGAAQTYGRVALTYDDELASLAARVPGLGGIFYDSAGRLTVSLRDPVELSAVRASLAQFLKRRIRPGSPAASRLDAEMASMRFVSAEFDFRDLLLWKRTVIDPMLGGAANYIDIDERRNRIVLGVWDAARIESLRALVTALPMPSLAVEVIQVAASRPEPERSFFPSLSALRILNGTLRDTYRPVPAGVEIQMPLNLTEFNRCTLGYNLRPISGGDPALRYAVTNSHCSKERSVLDLGDMGQAERFNNVATEVIDPAFFDNSQNPVCPVGKRCRYTDASLYKYFDAGTSRHGAVALPQVGSISFGTYATVTEVFSPTAGRIVHKIGRATGRTSGTITNTCVDEDVPFSDIRTLCNGIGSYESSTGDSGGPVIEPFGDGSAWAVGVHHGSGGRFSPMYAVLNELYEGNTALGYMDPIAEPGPPPPPGPGVSIVGPSHVRPNATCLWEASVTGTGPFTYYWTQNGGFIGSGSEVTTSFGSSGSLAVQVWDSYSQSASTTKTITVATGAPACFF